MHTASLQSVVKRKAKHLKGKKNQKISLGLGPQMLRLSGLEDQELQLAYWAGGDNRRRKNKW